MRKLEKKADENKKYAIDKLCKLKCKISRHPSEGCMFGKFTLNYIDRIRNFRCKRSTKSIKKSLR